MLSNQGSTILEAMIAFVIIAAVAVTVFPIFLIGERQSKYGDVKQLCQETVRGKLDEFRYGKVVSIEAEAGEDCSDPESAASPLCRLSIPTFTSDNDSAEIDDLVSGGFLYSKVLYNKYFNAENGHYICNGTSTADIFDEDDDGAITGDENNLEFTQVGARICVDSSIAPWDEKAEDELKCTGDIDEKVTEQLPGFKLYVKLEHETPWKYNFTKDSDEWKHYGSWDDDLESANHCPDENYSDSSSILYDFNGQGDSIKVTVTGIIDIKAYENEKIASVCGADAVCAEEMKNELNYRIGDVSDKYRLRCFASTVVRPYQHNIRFYLSQDRRIYAASSMGLDSSDKMLSFKSLYNQGGNFFTSGIRSFVVHPRNFSVYALKPGFITRYSKCGGVPLDCETDPALKGVRDDGQTSGVSVQEYKVPAGIQSIGVDFKTGLVYGFSGDKSDFYKIAMEFDGEGSLKNSLSNCENTGGTCQMGVGSYVVDTWSLEYDEVNEVWEFPKSLLANQDVTRRLKGFFMSPAGEEAFVIDNASAAYLGAASYSTSIFRLSDVNLLSPLGTFPVNAYGFSK